MVGRRSLTPSTARRLGRLVLPGIGAHCITLDPLERLARLCQHIPPPGLHLTRLYGAYANRTRGARARRTGAAAGAGPASNGSEPEEPTASQRERRRQWARLIAKVILQHRPRPEARAHAPPGG